MSCIIVFPLYQAPSEIELAFLEHGITMTKGHKQVIVAPEGLIIDEKFGQLQQLEVKRFAKHFFEGIAGYNRLLLSKDFYKAFYLYEFLLIHQADVYLFKDEVKTWCEKEYDYIGAPWFRPDLLNKGKLFDLLQAQKLKFKKNKVYAQRHNKVGNGGLSLRKIETALKVLEKADPKLLALYTKGEDEGFNEDIFWSLEAPNILPGFNIPSWQEGMQFAVEFHPAVAYNYLNEKLPFGCHAPLKHNPDFWQKHIPILKSNA